MAVVKDDKKYVKPDKNTSLYITGQQLRQYFCCPGTTWIERVTPGDKKMRTLMQLRFYRFCKFIVERKYIKPDKKKLWRYSNINPDTAWHRRMVVFNAEIDKEDEIYVFNVNPDSMGAVVVSSMPTMVPKDPPHIPQISIKLPNGEMMDYPIDKHLIEGMKEFLEWVDRGLISPEDLFKARGFSRELTDQELDTFGPDLRTIYDARIYDRIFTLLELPEYVSKSQPV